MLRYGFSGPHHTTIIICMGDWIGMASLWLPHVVVGSGGSLWIMFQSVLSISVSAFQRATVLRRSMSSESQIAAAAKKTREGV